MAYSFSVNNFPASGENAVWLLLQALVAAGWVVKADSDGTTYAAAGGQLTGFNAGARGLGNTSAWFRIQAPAVNGGATVNQQREFTFQRGASDYTWRIKYSASAGFTGGAPAAAVTPSATDEVYMAGGGTDAAPTYMFWFPPGSAGTYRWHIVCGGLAEKYSFTAFSSFPASIQVIKSGMALDVLVDGTYAATDPDPAVVYVPDYSGWLTDANVLNVTGAVANVTNPAKARAWMGATSAAAAATVGTNSMNVSLTGFGAAGGGGNLTLGPNMWTGKDDLFDLYWIRIEASVAPRGLKGGSRLFKSGSVVRQAMSPGSFASTNDMITWGNAPLQLWLPWNGSTPL